MPIDPIVALESLGYTRREASFLYLVAIHSGYFLRRQFDYFINRYRGGIVASFLRKSRINGHVQFLEAAHGRQVYHLFSKTIYRLTGNPDSQNRRVKGDADVRARLMKLDYILENEQEHFLASDRDKFELFRERRGIDPRTFTLFDQVIRPELRSLVVSLADRTRPASSLARFAFIDEGQLTTSRFERVLINMTPFLRLVRYFEVVYVSTSAHNFPEAQRVFLRQFAPRPQSQQPLLSARWHNAAPIPAASALNLHPEFVTLLLRSHYPSLRSNEVGCSVGCSVIASKESQ